MLGLLDTLEKVGAADVDQDGEKCLNTPKIYSFEYALSAGELRLDLQQTVDGKNDFFLRGIRVFDPDDAGSDLRFRIRLVTGYYLSNALIPVTAMPMRAITPELRITRGGAIGIEGQNLSAIPATLSIFFLGVLRHKVVRDAK